MNTITEENAKTKSDIAILLFARKNDDFRTFVSLAEKLLDRYVAEQENKFPNLADLKTYHMQLKHDNGVFNLTTSGTSYAGAIRSVMETEKCPERAIVKIWT